MILLPYKGAPYAEFVEMNIHVDLGSGPDAEAIAADMGAFKLCHWSGDEAYSRCMPLLSGGGIGVVRVAPPTPDVGGVAELRAWIQRASDPEAPGSQFSAAGDVTFTWRSAAAAVVGLQQRAASAEGEAFLAPRHPSLFGSAVPSHLNKSDRPMVLYHLGLALLRSSPRDGGAAATASHSGGGCGGGPASADASALTQRRAQASAAFGAAAALGVELAIGAREEAEWLAGFGGGGGRGGAPGSEGAGLFAEARAVAHPLFPCGHAGAVRFDLPPPHGGAETVAVEESFAMHAYPTWAEMRIALREVVEWACVGQQLASSQELPLRDQVDHQPGRALAECVEGGVAAARAAVAAACGDPGDLQHTLRTLATAQVSDINEHLGTLEALAAECASVLECGVRGVKSSWAMLAGLEANHRNRTVALASARGVARRQAVAVEVGAADAPDRAGGVSGTSSPWRGAAASAAAASAAVPVPVLIVNDIDECFHGAFERAAATAGVAVGYRWQDDLTLDLPSDLSPVPRCQAADGVGAEKGGEEPVGVEPTADGVDLVFIDTFHVYGQLKRELRKFAPWAKKYIVLHDTETDGVAGEAVRLGSNVTRLAGQLGWPEAEVRSGLQGAVDEFLAAHRGEWALRRKYTNNNGLTVLARVSPPA